MGALIGVYWALTGLIGSLVYGLTSRGDAGFYNIYPSDLFCREALYAHVLCGLGLIAGERLAGTRGSSMSLSHIVQSLSQISGNPIMIALTVFTTATATISMVSSYGLADLFVRDYYLAQEGSLAPVIAQLSSTIGILLAALMLTARRAIHRVIAVACLALLLILVFAKGSRYTIVGLLFAFSLPMLAARNPKVISLRAVYFILLGVLTIPALHTILYFRNESQYGLLIYASRIGDALSAITDDGMQAVWDIVLNLTFSLPVTQVTIDSGTGWREIAVAINPLPGFMTEWYLIAPQRRISDFIPFSAMGELFAYSPSFAMLYMAVAGALFGWCQRVAQCLSPAFKPAAWVMLLVMCFLFAVLTPQYNLRSVSRLLVYLSVAFLVLSFVDSHLKIRRATWIAGGAGSAKAP
jgi:hypothetical protein